MSTKTENVKTFINQIGSTNQLFLFVGNSQTDSESDSPKREIDTWKESDFSVKIGKDNVIGVTKNIKWIRKRAYTPWSSSIKNIGNYYVYNEENGYVYLCLTDNSDNRKDLHGQYVSNYVPSHSAGDQTYADGYTWKALYKITPSLEKFVTEEWIPVVSFDNFENLDKTSPYTQIVNYCYPLGTSSDAGTCNLYYKDNFDYYDQTGTLVVGIKGELHKSISDFTCIECYNTFKDHPKFVSTYTTELTEAITVQDKYDQIAELIQQHKVSTASPYYYLYTANALSPDEGYIVSVSIDLSQFDLEELKVSTDNPPINIASNTGTGASMRLKTYRSATGSIYIKGIEIISKGSGYKDVRLSVDASYLSGGISSTELVSAIVVNLDEIDGLGFDPMKVLTVEHTMIDVKVEKQKLIESDLSIPNSINFYTLVQNPLYGETDQYVAGSDENKYESTLYRTTTKLTLDLTVENPVADSSAEVATPEGDILGDLTITNVEESEDIGFNPSAKAELKGIEYSKIDSLVGSTITIDGEDFTIANVEEKPFFVQYSGKVLSTKKSTAISIDDDDTAIIRINMVKGM